MDNPGVIEQKSRSAGISTSVAPSSPAVTPLNRKARRRLERKQEKARKKAHEPRQLDVNGTLKSIKRDPKTALLGHAMNSIAERQQKLEIALRVLGQVFQKKGVISEDELKSFEVLLTQGPAPLQQSADDTPEDENERAAD